MHTQSFKPRQAQRGVAMVEFAITLPLLLLLLLAIGEFGRMFYHYNNLLQANRDAVRYLAGEAWNGNLGQVVTGPLNGSTELGCSLGDGFDVIGQDVGSTIQVAGKAQLKLLGAVAVPGCRFLQFIRQAEGSAAGHKPCFTFSRGSNTALLQALA